MTFLGQAPIPDIPEELTPLEMTKILKGRMLTVRSEVAPLFVTHLRALFPNLPIATQTIRRTQAEEDEFVLDRAHWEELMLCESGNELDRLRPFLQTPFKIFPS